MKNNLRNTRMWTHGSVKRRKLSSQYLTIGYESWTPDQSFIHDWPTINCFINYISQWLTMSLLKLQPFILTIFSPLCAIHYPLIIWVLRRSKEEMDRSQPTWRHVASGLTDLMRSHLYGVRAHSDSGGVFPPGSMVGPKMDGFCWNMLEYVGKCWNMLEWFIMNQP